MKTVGHVIPVAAICVAIFIAAMAVRPAPTAASPVAAWQCGNITVSISSPAGRGGLEETTVTLIGPDGFTSNKGRVGHDFHFRFTMEGEGRPVRMREYMGWTGGKAYLNSKRCKDYVEEDDEVQEVIPLPRPRPKEAPQ
jgi:hypothetical protein